MTMRLWAIAVAVLAVSGALWGSGEEETDVRGFFDEYGCTIYRMIDETEYAPVADIVVALGALESGYGRARWVPVTKQVFGITENRELQPGEIPIDRLMKFESISAAVIWLTDMFRRRKYPSQREAFLRRLETAKYSTTPGYADRVRGCLMRVWHHLKHCNTRGGLSSGTTIYPTISEALAE